MSYFLQQLANAAAISTLYAALAFGYAIAFAVTKRADITYGALFAFSGQMFILFFDIGWNRLWLAFAPGLVFGAVLALVYTGGAAALIARHVMRPLAFSSANAVVVAALGCLLVLMETGRLASRTRDLWLPPFLNQPVLLWNDPGFAVTLTLIQILNAGLMLALIIGGHLVLTRSPVGRQWRSVCEDRLAAALCGVDAGRVFVCAYLAAGLIAALCGILAASYYGSLDFGSGLVFGLKILFIAAIGGPVSPLAAAGGAALVGLVETMWSAYGPLLWRDLAVFSFLILMLVVTRRQPALP